MQAETRKPGAEPTVVGSNNNPPSCVSRLIDKSKDLPAIIMIVRVFRIVRLLKLPVGRREVSVNYSGTGRPDGRISIRLSDHRVAPSSMLERRRRSFSSVRQSLSGLTSEQKSNTRGENKERAVFCVYACTRRLPSATCSLFAGFAHARIPVLLPV